MVNAEDRQHTTGEFSIPVSSCLVFLIFLLGKCKQDALTSIIHLPLLIILHAFHFHSDNAVQLETTPTILT